ncbi:transcriptional repressor [soil metagenome]
MRRQTNQREAIRRAIDVADRPVTPLEIRGAAEAEIPGLGIATVYRAIKDLVEEGWLIAVEIPGEPPRYEVASKPHHHHFHCRKCGTVYEVEGCPGDLKKLAPRGFLLEGHELILKGLCRACR